MAEHSYLGTHFDIGDMIKHFDGTVGRVIAVHGLAQDSSQVIEWNTAGPMKQRRTSVPSSLKRIDETQLRWRAT